MIDIVRKELSNHSTISRMPMAEWSASVIIISLIMMGAGVFLTCLGFGIIPIKYSNPNLPLKTFIFSGGGFFFLAGFSTLISWVSALWRKLQLNAIEKIQQSEVWCFDYSWDRQRVKDNSFKGLSEAWSATLFFLLFILPFNWLVCFGEDIPIFLKGVIGIFDIVIIGILVRSIYLSWQYCKYGTSQLNFNQFPFFLGEKIDVLLQSAKPVEGCKSLHLALRCIEERYELRRSGNKSQMEVISYQIYEDTLIIAAEAYQQGILRIPVNMPLPDGQQYETCLRKRPPTYWELAVKAEIPGIDYAASFLLPVYLKQ